MALKDKRSANFQPLFLFLLSFALLSAAGTVMWNHKNRFKVDSFFAPQLSAYVALLLLQRMQSFGDTQTQE
jgi:hypothetical protein